MLSLLAALALQASAPTAAPPQPVEDPVQRYYPARARALGKEGRASMRCVVTDAGTLKDCVVVSETPPDFGFGEAALKMAKLFRMKVKKADDRLRAPTTVVIPIRFDLK